MEAETGTAAGTAGSRRGGSPADPSWTCSRVHTLSSFTEHDDLPIVLHSDLLGGVVLVDVADMDTHHKQKYRTSL